MVALVEGLDVDEGMSDATGVRVTRRGVLRGPFLSTPAGEAGLVFDKLPLSQPTNQGKPDMGATVRYPLTWKTAPEHQTSPQHPPDPSRSRPPEHPAARTRMPPAGASGTGMAGGALRR